MAGNGIKNKLMHSDTMEGIQVMTQLQYNTHTDHIGIGNTFHKSHGFNNGSMNNKKCSTYLGITVAEEVLSKVFKNVERMPTENKGFDIICNQGYKIDIKSATKNKKSNAWLFNIKQNSIADYFLCLAFDNRHNLNPMHLWLIPANKINHLKTFEIFVSTIDKWNKYELSNKMDKVITYCNIMKGDN